MCDTRARGRKTFCRRVVVSLRETDERQSTRLGDSVQWSGSDGGRGNNRDAYWRGGCPEMDYQSGEARHPMTNSPARNQGASFFDKVTIQVQEKKSGREKEEEAWQAV